MLIYTLFSLHRHCEKHIDTVYINDDLSGDATVAHYLDDRLHQALAPWKLRVRVNERRAGYGKTLYTSRSRPRDLNQARRFLRALLLGGLHATDDIRYQWAIDRTDKRYLFIVHDDIRFHADVVGLYIDTIRARQNCAIVGDLGQCWICGHAPGCRPQEIVAGSRPSVHWPLTPSAKGPLPLAYDRACRINEWCCLVDVGVARRLGSGHGVFFGNCDDGGDTAAYWFARALDLGYAFDDPLPSAAERHQYYDHGWVGHSGHSVWCDQGAGKKEYDSVVIRTLLREEFGYDIGG